MYEITIGLRRSNAVFTAFFMSSDSFSSVRTGGALIE
jgi:hypothetical protein